MIHIATLLRCPRLRLLRYLLPTLRPGLADVTPAGGGPRDQEVDWFQKVVWGSLEYGNNMVGKCCYAFYGVELMETVHVPYTIVHDSVWYGCWDLWDRSTTSHVGLLLMGWGWQSWGMRRNLVLRTWFIATMQKIYDDHVQRHMLLTNMFQNKWDRSLRYMVATLLMGWGGGLGHVHVPCTEEKSVSDIAMFISEIFGIKLTNVKSCWKLMMVVLSLGKVFCTYVALRTWSFAMLRKVALWSFTTLHVATLHHGVGWAGGGWYMRTWCYFGKWSYGLRCWELCAT